MAQRVQVIDQVSRNPLPLVTVRDESNPKALLVTNENGYIDISSLASAHMISFDLIGYSQLRLSYKELAVLSQIELEETNISLDEVVISANRWEQDGRQIPNKITNIKPRQVAFENPQTAADLLAGTGEVFIQKSQLGGGSPMIRGFAANRILIAVDGVRMNNAIFRGGNLQNVISIDPMTLEETEVLFGPGSVMYGSDAIGGVMDFHTLQPEIRDSAHVSGHTALRYASASNENMGHIDVRYGKGKWGFISSVTHSKFADLTMGSNGPNEYLRPFYVRTDGMGDTIVGNPTPRIQSPTGYNQLSVMQKIRLQVNSDWDFQYGFHYSQTSHAPRYDRLIEELNGALRFAEWSYGPQVWMMNSLRIEHTSVTQWYDHLRIVVGHQHFEESRVDRQLNATPRRIRTENVDAQNINLDLDKQLAPKHQLYYGAELVNNTVSSKGIQTDLTNHSTVAISSRYPDGSTWQSLAVYANHTFLVSDQLTFQSGARFNSVRLKAMFDTNFFSFPFAGTDLMTSALNGSVGAAYRPTDNWQLNINFSTGFRAPNIDDVGKVFDSEPGAVIVPNSNLNSEYALNYEASVSKVFGSKLKLNATGYYTLLSDAMVRRPFSLDGQDSIIYDGTLSRVLAIQNATSATVRGAQIGFDWKATRNWSFSSRINWQTGEEEDEESGDLIPLRHTAPAFGTIGVTYLSSHFRTQMNLRFNDPLEFDELAPSEQNKPHIYAKDDLGRPYSPRWYSLDVKGSYQFGKKFQVTGGIENLTDQRYRPYSSGIAAPGRNFILAIRGSF